MKDEMQEKSRNAPRFTFKADSRRRRLRPSEKFLPELLTGSNQFHKILPPHKYLYSGMKFALSENRFFLFSPYSNRRVVTEDKAVEAMP